MRLSEFIRELVDLMAYIGDVDVNLCAPNLSLPCPDDDKRKREMEPMIVLLKDTRHLFIGRRERMEELDFLDSVRTMDEYKKGCSVYEEYKTRGFRHK